MILNIRLFYIQYFIIKFKFGDKGENDRINQLLRKFVLGKDAMNRKILQKYFHSGEI